MIRSESKPYTFLGESCHALLGFSVCQSIKAEGARITHLFSHSWGEGFLTFVMVHWNITQVNTVDITQEESVKYYRGVTIKNLRHTRSIHSCV